MRHVDSDGLSAGISWRELGFVGSVAATIVYVALEMGSIKQLVKTNTEDVTEQKKSIAGILQHDANTTARLENHERVANELRKADEATRIELLQRRSEFPTQFQFNEYKVHSDALVASKLNRDTFDAWKGQNDRTVELLQRQIEDINRQIAASVLQQQIKFPERSLSLSPSSK